ncbi:hypothetical protein C1Y63_04140 [Corynebacterium sp. 13CS0277]|uniref:hypothetical protein n=1 Tax=Corynebacterium sp. 13CS0277 TaxID=2071994 RepID=UPI000D032E2B|nr:hypothetical protein [Corynebacterium sp. 13CS0277]PRQ11839.1 hypothetical protein C1Y63_04140 [Corynebacterium sp. 13CS0277]
MNGVLAVAMASMMLLPAILMWAIAEKAATGQLQRNSMAGIRMAPLTESEEQWQAGHAAARPILRLFLGVQLALTVVCVAVYFLAGDGPFAIVLMLLPVVLLGFLGWAVVAARRAAEKA